MTADLPWFNSFFGNVLADSSENIAAPYAIFYVNMSLASTYLTATMVILLLILGCFIAFKSLGKYD